MKSEDLAGEIDCTEIKQLAKQPKKERNQKQNQKQKQVGNWESPWALSTDIYIMALLSTISDYSRLGITCVACCRWRKYVASIDSGIKLRDRVGGEWMQQHPQLACKLNILKRK